jgi:hypothetical protein
LSSAAIPARRRKGLGVYNEIERPPSVIDTGAFYPAFAGIAGQLWQQVQQPGNPDMFKVEANVVRDAWQDYWGAFFEGGFDILNSLRTKKNSDDQAQWIWAALTPYICVIQQNGKSITLGMANIDRPHPGPLVTVQDLHQGAWPGHARAAHALAVRRGPNAPRAGTSSKGPGDMTVLDSNGRLLSPARILAGTRTVGREARSQPWPTGVELFSYYQRPDQAIITPACDALGRAQLRSLETTLVCAYVRPVESQGMPAYAAFTGKGTALRDRCLAVRAAAAEARGPLRGRPGRRRRGRPGLRRAAAQGRRRDQGGQHEAQRRQGATARGAPVRQGRGRDPAR